jgi:hypothetical protein
LMITSESQLRNWIRLGVTAIAHVVMSMIDPMLAGVGIGIGTGINRLRTRLAGWSEPSGLPRPLGPLGPPVPLNWVCLLLSWSWSSLRPYGPCKLLNWACVLVLSTSGWANSR